MNDTLNREEREKGRSTPRASGGSWTMSQWTERLGTQARLYWKRLGRGVGNAVREARRQKRRPSASSPQKKQSNIRTAERRPLPGTVRTDSARAGAEVRRRSAATPAGTRQTQQNTAWQGTPRQRPTATPAEARQAQQNTAWHDVPRQRPAATPAEARRAQQGMAWHDVPRQRPEAATAQIRREPMSRQSAAAPAAVRHVTYGMERQRSMSRAAAGTRISKGASPGLWQQIRAEAHHIQRRWRHIRREQKAQRFPESNRMLIQLVLLTGGLLPMMGNHLREKLMGRHRRAVRRTNGILARFEGRRKLRPVAFFAIVGVVAGVTIFFSFYTYGTTVTYDGEVVGKLSSKMTAQNAAHDLEKVTATTLGGSYTISSSLLQYSSELMPRSELTDTKTFQEKLSQDIGLVTYGYSLYVDDTFIGATPYEGALEELLDQMHAGVRNEDTIYCDFQEKVEVKPGYIPTERIMNLGYIAETLYSTKTEEVTYTIKGGDTWSEIAEDHGMTSKELLAKNPGYDINHINIGEVLTMSAAVPYLTLKVTQRESYVTDIPYQIVYTDTSSLYKGDTRVTSAGVYGKADVTANVTYVNGEETERTVLSYVRLAEPVTEQQLRGTKERPTWLPTGTFRWPCSGHITSRFGYRSSPGGIGSTNHKGIDIANGYGTAVCASDGGTVAYAGWMGGYGYMVQINHGNGVVTYYGHNSRLLVKKGDHVYPGQQIARMGSTGNSTGNHCHFEIRVNGVPKNPLNYL